MPQTRNLYPTEQTELSTESRRDASHLGPSVDANEGSTAVAEGADGGTFCHGDRRVNGRGCYRLFLALAASHYHRRWFTLFAEVSNANRCSNEGSDADFGSDIRPFNNVLQIASNRLTQVSAP